MSLKRSDKVILVIAGIIIVLAIVGLIYVAVAKAAGTEVQSRTQQGSLLFPVSSSGGSIMSSASGSFTPAHKTVPTSAIPGYFRVVGSCNWAFKGSECITPRIGPGTSYKEASILGIPYGSPYKIRNDQMVHGTGSFVDVNGETWVQVDPTMTELVHPDRIPDRYWYISADYLEPKPINESTDGSGKTIRVNLTEQVGYAMSGSTVVKSFLASTGRDGLETPVGNFAIFAKYPLKSMESPLTAGAGGEKYTLFSPFSMAFTVKNNARIYLHAEYWHNSLGHRISHGCINLSFDDAKWLYEWAPIGTPVITKY